MITSNHVQEKFLILPFISEPTLHLETSSQKLFFSPPTTNKIAAKTYISTSVDFTQILLFFHALF